MIRNNDKQHLLTIICSLNKSIINAKLTGKLNSSEIYILNIIYNLLFKFTLTEEDKNNLSLLYNKIFYESSSICKDYTIDSSLNKSTPIFAQNSSESTVTYPAYRFIEYWQENSITNDINDIIPIIEDIIKQSDTYENFAKGKTINYSNIGRICFLLNDENSINYSIYNPLDIDVTLLFDVQYISEINSVLFVSKDIYSHGSIKFKIIKD